ncbi:unnamed protein product [Medioppia subpectinata]|uniref:FHA domain-containing protein n=1 Tax=Medioppia subpectinata TaxID=1979941 RepID=A0A7R9PZI7_9ACAR|nr:unnamed protein product [Medioppia subpectinata]CAG2106515.1 unnamed protein product [Medioppia subpectinata]
MDREDRHHRRRGRDDRRRSPPALEADPHMAWNELRDRAKDEQRGGGRRHPYFDRQSGDNRHGSRGQRHDRDFGGDNDRHRRGRDNDRRHESNDNRNRDTFDKSDEFWSKESKAKTKSDDKDVVKEKEKPNLLTTGKLAEDTNTFNGVVIKYGEPTEARKPKRRWRLYPFKGQDSLDFIPIHRQSAYLLGRDRKIADIPIDHPSCSKQHSVLQFRLIEYKREDGSTGKRIRPYIIDLESSNGTYVNNQRIDAKCYVELFEKDVIKFGFSSREYVVLHEQSKDESDDDDIQDAEEPEVEIKTEPKD